jgi:hypothetical protein
LKERSVPPSKVYIPLRGKERDFYAILADSARNLFPAEKVDPIILYSLNQLTKRAVYVEELSRAGIEGNIPGRLASAEEKLEAKKVMSRSGFKIPDSSRAYVMEGEDLEKQFVLLIESILIENYDISYLVKETKQMKLKI